MTAAKHLEGLIPVEWADQGQRVTKDMVESTKQSAFEDNWSMACAKTWTQSVIHRSVFEQEQTLIPVARDRTTI